MRIVAGKLKNRKIYSPKGQETRPTSEQAREALFNICQMYIEGAQFLDLFAGSGAIGIEALSRGAWHATFVDSSRESIQCIRKNVQELELIESATIIQGNVINILKSFGNQQKKFDIIFADPPYETKIDHEVYSHYVIRAVSEGNLLTPSGFLFVEDSSHVHSIEVDNLSFVNVRRMGKSTLMQYRNQKM